MRRGKKAKDRNQKSGRLEGKEAEPAALGGRRLEVGGRGRQKTEDG